MKNYTQVYVKNSFEAAETYCKAFGAEITREYKNEDTGSSSDSPGSPRDTNERKTYPALPHSVCASSTDIIHLSASLMVDSSVSPPRAITISSG